MSEIAETMFPDDAGLNWDILSLRLHPVGFDVTAKSRPADVGYNPVRFIVRFLADGTADAAGAYIESKDGGWNLLAGDPGTELPSRIE